MDNAVDCMEATGVGNVDRDEVWYISAHCAYCFSSLGRGGMMYFLHSESYDIIMAFKGVIVLSMDVVKGCQSMAPKIIPI